MEARPFERASGLNLKFLSDQEKRTLPPPVLSKIAQEWRSKEDLISTLQTEVERYETNQAQQSFQYEKELEETHQRLEQEVTLRNKAEKELNDLKENVLSLEKSLQVSSDKVKLLNNQIEELKAEKDGLSTQSVAVAANLDSKTRMYNLLREQMNSLEEKLAESQKSKCEALLLSEEANSTQLQMQFKERYFEQEKGFFTNQIELLHRQLEEKSTEVLTLRQEHSKALISLQAELSHALEETKTLQNENASYQCNLEEKSRKIEDLLKTLNEVRESEASLETSYKKELLAQEKLANIYKDASEDQKKRCEELEKAVDELKHLLQEASEQFGALEKAKSRVELEAQKTLNQRDSLIKELKNELENVNELLRCSERKGEEDHISELSPSAGMAHQLMEKGLSLSQLYTEYLNTSKRLFKMEDENKRLSRYMDQILREIAEKAPVLNKQREDYEKALDTINTLHMQIDNAVEELEKQREESEEAKRRSNFLGRENDRMNKQVKDLSKQVSVLLTQVEAARSGLPPPSANLLDGVFQAHNAGDVIEQHLLTFRNNSELQEKNLKLLTSLRDLSEKMESAEKTAVESKTQDLLDELEACRKELDDLKSSRERMQSAVENITRQRDVYRTIVDQQSSNKSMNGGKSFELDDASNEISTLRKELENSKKETDKVKKEYEDYRIEKSRNEQMAKNELHQMKLSYEKVKMENVKLLSQAEYNEERLKTLQKNCEAYLRQVNALSEKCDTLQGIVGRHESTIDTLKDNILRLTKDLSHYENSTSNLTEEKILLKEKEARLLTELESFRNSQFSQSMIVSNLESIKNNLEKRDYEIRIGYENQLSDLTKQCCSLKAKIESNVDLKEAQMKINTMEGQISSLNAELSKMREALEQSEREMKAVKAEKEDLLKQHSTFKVSSPSGIRSRITSPMQASPALRSASPSLRQRSPFSHAGGPLPHTIRELEIQLSEEKAKNNTFQQAVQRAESHVNNLKKITEDQEIQLKENTVSAKAAEEEINKLRGSVTQAEAKVLELTEQLRESTEREKILKETTDNQLMSITEDLEERENELDEAQKKVEELKEAADKARLELNSQLKISSEIQDKYEREVMLHAADLKAVTTLKEKLTDSSLQLENITADKLKAEEKLSSLKEGFQERESLLEKTAEELKLRNAELEDQNKLLLDQLTQLTDKLSAIQNKLSTSGDSGNTSFSEEDARTTEQLREIIKYLRREREIAISKVEVSQAEAVRLSAHKKSLEGKLDHLNKCLSEEREKNKGSVETNSKYIDLMRKVHTMDALADSNRLLRQEKDSQKHELAEAKAKVASLQSQIDPLQENLRLTKNELESVSGENKKLESSRDSYKKRSEELVEKLNRTRPEDMIKLQQEVASLKKDLQGKESEVNRLKNIHSNLQKVHQAAMAHKNELLQQVQHLREESKKYTLENKKLIDEKGRLQRQHNVSLEKIKTLEASVAQSNASQQQEQQRSRDQKSQMIQQLLESRQKEEATRKELEETKKTLESKVATLKLQEAKLTASVAKIDGLAKQCNQLRKIANKYKMKVESGATVDSGESSTVAVNEEEGEDKKSIASTSATGAVPKSDENEKLTDEITKLKESLAKKEEEIMEMRAQGSEGPSKLQADLELKSQELQEAYQSHSQFKEKFQKELSEMTKTLEESQSKKLVFESLISKMEREKETSQQEIESLNKKLSMQQKLIENLQKGSTSQKVSPNLMNLEKPVTDSPPTANIKPMAVPPTAPAISSPRSQAVSQPGTSRAIPTASIRPMAPTPLSSGQTSVMVVTPLDTHSSGDGAVSSTVTLPQATVTPTPVAPASTTTQAFPLSLTATVSPISTSQMPVTSSASFSVPQVASISRHQEDSMDVAAPTTSSAADSLISQAIAMVAPQIEDRFGGQKRKLEVLEEEEEEHQEEESGDESMKRSRTQQQQEETTEESSHEEDMGEPSSSSTTSGRKVESEVFIVSSDDEDESEVPPPPTQSGHEESARDTETNSAGVQQDIGGREAEAERRTEDEVGESFSSRVGAGDPTSEHPSSSSRQSLPHFHPLTTTQYEEDDRQVPSTPTLVVPRTCEGIQGDGVTSVQVPSRGFEFTSSSASQATTSNDGLAEMTEGGIIDVSRMDLAQLDENSRPLPSTSASGQQRIEGDVSTEGRITSSEIDSLAVSQEDPLAEGSSHSNEPDSGAHFHSGGQHHVLEDIEDSSGDGEVSRPDRGVPSYVRRVSSDDQEDEADPIPDPDSESQSHEDDEEGEEEEEEEEVPSPVVIEDDDDDEDMVERGEGIASQEVSVHSHHQRATRSASAAQLPSRGRTITPITWEQGASMMPSTRPMFRGRGGRQMQAGQTTRQQHPRGVVQRGRRSRPMYYGRGGSS